MNIEVRYDKKDVEKLVLEKHTAAFGAAPEGQKWSCRESFGDYKVENIDVEKPEQAEVVAVNT